ncbi:tetratricopeptide repeat protein [Limisphaera sp. 4302-co]|uniref:tetratricopeptide repeat protein n=1 Tax=Limisphaera sp. 4302-co TaxID=3400417 RepID=UPI003C2502D5
MKTRHSWLRTWMAAQSRRRNLATGGARPCRRRWWVLGASLVLCCGLTVSAATSGQTGREKAGRGNGTAETGQPSGSTSLFAPVEGSNPLAALWNRPDFQQRLLGSYGFQSAVEPRLREEEQRIWREQVVPALREGPTRAVEVLKPLARPENSAVFDFALGTALFQSGDLSQARVWLESAVAKHPDYLRAWKNLGYVAVRLGDAEGAVRALSRALELGGADAATLGLLGFAHLQAGRPVAAAAATEQALIFRPDDLPLQLQLLQAWAASGRYEPALKLVEELLNRDPDRAALWTWKAKLHLLRNERTEAAVAYEAVRRLGAARAEDLFTLADLYVLLETPDTALPVYQEALEKEPDAGWQRVLRAVEVMLAQGQTEMGEKYLTALGGEDGAAVPVEHRYTWTRLKARAAMSRASWDEALQLLEALLTRDPMDGQALIWAAECYAQKGDRERAEFRYQAAAQIESSAADALVKHAQLLVRYQEYRRAAELLQRAQRLRPRETVQRYLDEVLKLAAQRPAAS